MSENNIFIGQDNIGIINLGEISGDVSNTINQLSQASESDQSELRELLLQLQKAIETETELPNEDKANALEEVKTLAKAAQKPEDNKMKRAAKKALTFLKGTTVGMSETTKLVQECGKLLPAIATLLSLI